MLYSTTSNCSKHKRKFTNITYVFDVVMWGLQPSPPVGDLMRFHSQRVGPSTRLTVERESRFLMRVRRGIVCPSLSSGKEGGAVYGGKDLHASRTDWLVGWPSNCLTCHMVVRFLGLHLSLLRDKQNNDRVPTTYKNMCIVVCTSQLAATLTIAGFCFKASCVLDSAFFMLLLHSVIAVCNVNTV